MFIQMYKRLILEMVALAIKQEIENVKWLNVGSAKLIEKTPKR